MQALASAGAKVLDPRSVALATERRVPVHVRSSLTEEVGTWIVGDEDDRARGVVGIALGRSTFDGSPAMSISVVGAVADRGAVALDAVPALSKQHVTQGIVYVTREEDARSAACAIHTLYGLDEEPRRTRSALPIQSPSTHRHRAYHDAVERIS